MSTNETLQRFEELTKHYLEELNDYSLEQLTRQPSEDEWSLGQMYLHLINTAMYMQLQNIELCKNEANVTAEEKTEAGQNVFTRGAFPPVRIKLPASPQHTPQQPVSKEQIADGLNTVLARMKEVEPSLSLISPQHKVAHPRLGALNAVEWYQLIEMHYRHHLGQKDRLKGFLQAHV
ncbi:DinB family protein [Brevibacillus dissolubilis]|uniref:DinB family protein n=1 Tax=Brevibacillus dissolubilis TaxID=1844116 RepID=UPI001115CDB8|nr:DinB family protein [Brevibacillus dissolubilis]